MDLQKKGKSNFSHLKNMIIKKAIMLSRDQDFLANNPNIVDFKFSRKQFGGFLRQHDLSERRRTTVAQQLPAVFFELFYYIRESNMITH